VAWLVANISRKEVIMTNRINRVSTDAEDAALDKLMDEARERDEQALKDATFPKRLVKATINEVKAILAALGFTDARYQSEGWYECSYCGHVHMWEFYFSPNTHSCIEVCPIKRVIEFLGTACTDEVTDYREAFANLPDSYRREHCTSTWTIKVHPMALEKEAQHVDYLRRKAEAEQCEARTRKGTRCKNKAFKGGFCKVHQGYIL
jgi:regulator of extracellular matrix RemA (YlzA/DUF370 family)